MSSDLVKLSANEDEFLAELLKDNPIYATRKPGSFRRFIDRTGQAFGRLTIIHELGHKKVVCRCVCGHLGVFTKSEVVKGGTRSCGCLHSEITSALMKVRDRTHGLSETPEFKSWCAMLHRCTVAEAPDYKHYGGRGITVCERWKNSFEAFLGDMGPRPSQKYSIDRYPDNNGNYQPGNCRWATMEQQTRNMRTNRLLTLGDTTMCLQDWADSRGMNVGTLHSRLKLGMDLETALNKLVKDCGVRRYAA